MQSGTGKFGHPTRVVALVTLLAVSLPSCESVSGFTQSFSGVPEEELTPAEVELRAQADKFDTSDFDATVAAGCVAGVLAGVLIGALIAGGGNRGGGAALGAAAGLAVGCGGGYYVANKKEEYAQAENKLDVLVADARSQGDDLAKMIATTEIVIQQNRDEVASIKGLYRQGLASSEYLQTKIRKVRENQEVINDTVANLEKRIEKMNENVDQYQLANEDAYVGRLVGEIKNFENKKEAMEALLVAMDQFVESIELEEPLG